MADVTVGTRINKRISAFEAPLLPCSGDKEIGFRLTERDYGLFKFLLDQKFASLEILFFRFFDQRKSHTEPLPENLAAARQRLGILKRAGLINTERVYSEPKSVYLLTKTGWKALQGKYPDHIYASPAITVDFRNFDHDSRVSLVRVAFETAGKVERWYPERRIRMEGFKAADCDWELPETIVPDGIFRSSKGERIALEVEVSVRKKGRFRFKIREYERLFNQSLPLLHRVLFVACADNVGKDLAELMPKDPRFLLESYSHFVHRLFPPANGGKQ